MRLRSPLTIPPVIDLHVHLRQDLAMMELATRAVRDGGTRTVYVMPNLTPPLTSLAAVTSYHDTLQSIAQSLNADVSFLMTLYLHPSLTPELIHAAATLTPSGGTGRLIQGVKAYPAGVTTNSAAGVTDFSAFYPIFAAMQDHDLILNIHGETPGEGPLAAETAFLPTLRNITTTFPRLRIVLEHTSTRAALEAVMSCGPNVRCTITAHHLHLTSADWAGAESSSSAADTSSGSVAHNWCKPAAKSENDRQALIQAIVRGGPKVMFGSDSAPHPAAAKATAPPAAGCFTQEWTASLVVQALEEGVTRGWLRAEEVTADVLHGFLGGRAREFLRAHWNEKPGHRVVRLSRQGEKTPLIVKAEREGEMVEVVPFHAGKPCWSVEMMEGKADAMGMALDWEE